MNYNEQFKELFLQMKREVAAIASASSNRLVTVQESYILVSRYCEQVVAATKFESAEQEVEFFKKIRPGFEAELIYFEELYYILSSLPERRRAAIRFLYKQYLPVRIYCRRYQLLFEYWSLGRSEFDLDLFVHSQSNKILLLTRPLPSGDVNATPAGKAFARFRAHNELHGFLEKEISRLKNREEKGSYSIQWTATKAALVELAYALKATGAINNGNASIRDIATHLERMFNQDLTQFYRTFQEIRIRKNSRTTFLDRMKVKLERWMDNTDLNSRGED
ncbi:RteC domain-containing protein [uncultured Algoriphagus sp.]|uniref:RteC domain-containing protein n=1 Tax=uncultured Algoriphagus sp. TaxID=417365 RepID=UPI0030ED7942|tara:strand:+ start:9691 stop:10524 length:834 start_codon:yes stop_codon:yes gene_type:complete